MGELKLTGVTKDFGKVRVIPPTDLTLPDGEFIVFVGPSGCGKSTMLRMIAGLEEISAGTIEIDGTVVNDLAPVDRGIAMVFQSYALYPHMSVFENIAFPLRVAKMAQAEVEARVARAAEVLKLTDRLDHRPGALSGGQRQRVAIGRAIVREPSVFLFDEPLSNLDAALRAEMRVELSRLHGQLSNTMIYVTHDQIEAMTMADRIVVLDGGHVSQVGSPLELYHRPRNRFVAGFIGNPNMNFLPARITGIASDGLSVQLDGGPEVSLPVAPGAAQVGDQVTLGIRPDDLTEQPGGLTARADVVEHLGHATVIYATCDTGAEICMVGPGTSAVQSGTDLGLGFAGADAHLFDADGQAFYRNQVPVALPASATAS